MPGNIPISQAAPLYTMGLQAKFDELSVIKVNNFLSSFFTDDICKERYPVIDVRRGTEKVAIDLMRGHQGTRVQITKSTQKAFDPFYYKLYFDATQLDCYFRVFGSDSFNNNDMAELINGVATHNKVNQDMIERAKELFCAQIFETGTCTSLRDGSIVDFKRKAGSMVDLGAGFYWTTDGTNPFADLKAGGDFIRTEGKAGGYIINAIFGTEAWAAFRNNTTVKERLKEFNNRRDLVTPAQLDSTGAIYQGEIDCDSYMLRCWTYNEFYDDPETGESTPYVHPKKVTLVAENPMFKMIYGATPQVVMPGTGTSKLVAAKYVLSDFANAEEKYHRFYMESSPLPVPVRVDCMYTLQVVG